MSTIFVAQPFSRIFVAQPFSHIFVDVHEYAA